MRPAYIDQHSIDIQTGQDRAWEVLRAYVDGLGFPRQGPLGRVAQLVWAADPPYGFEMAEERVGEAVVLDGQHRFSRYRLGFELVEGPGGTTTLTARSYGDFPGPHGAAYRALVVGTGAHRVAVRRMLASVAAQAERQA